MALRILCLIVPRLSLVVITSPSVLIVPSPAPITPLPVNKFLNKLAPDVFNYVPTNQLLCSFALFLIVSLTPFINKPDSLRDLTIFMISFKSSFENTDVVVPDSKSCFFFE